MKVGFTGTRLGMSQHQKEQFVLKLYDLGIHEFHHGDCIGADADAHDIVRLFFPNVKIVVHPPYKTKTQAFKTGDESRFPAPYITRDRAIVNETEYLIGSPHCAEIIRSGTWTTIRYARKTGKPHTVLER